MSPSPEKEETESGSVQLKAVEAFTEFLNEYRKKKESKEKQKDEVTSDTIQGFFESLFQREEELRRLYEQHCPGESLLCLVCEGIGSTFPSCESLVQHCGNKLDPEPLEISAHRGYKLDPEGLEIAAHRGYKGAIESLVARMDSVKVSRKLHGVSIAAPLNVQYKTLMTDEELHQKASTAFRKFCNKQEVTNGPSFLKFFEKIFQEDEHLSKLYDNDSNEGHYRCLVCSGSDANLIRSFSICSRVLIHSVKAYETETHMKAAHWGYAQAISILWESNFPPSDLPHTAQSPQDQRGNRKKTDPQ